MPTQVIPAGYARVTQFFSVPGTAGPAMVTFGCHPGNGDNPNDLASDIRGFFVARLGPTITNTTFIDQTSVLYNDAGTFLVGQATGLDNGSLSGAALPPQNAIIAKKLTGLAGRRFRGRWYIPGLQESDVDEKGFISSTRRASLDTAVGNIVSDLIARTPTSPMVLLHAPGQSATPSPTVVNATIVEQLIATQRRRLR